MKEISVLHSIYGTLSKKPGFTDKLGSLAGTKHHPPVFLTVIQPDAGRLLPHVNIDTLLSVEEQGPEGIFDFNTPSSIQFGLTMVTS